MHHARAALLAFATLTFAACGSDPPSAPGTRQDLACADSDGACGDGCTPWDDLDCLDVARVEADVAYLASPALAGRGAGSTGNLLAVEYVAERMANLGLSPAGDREGSSRSLRQAFPYSTWDVATPPAVTIAGSALAYPADFTAVRFSGTADVTAPDAAFVGYGLTLEPYDRAAFPDCPLAAGYDDYAGLDVRGRVVIAARGLPFSACPSSSATSQWSNARAHGAAALVLTRNFAAPDGPPPHNAALSPVVGAETSGLPVLYATRAALEQRIPQLRAWLEQIEATNAPSSHLVAGAAGAAVSGARRDTHLENVIGAIAGTDPVLGREVVVVGAHLDHEGAVPLSQIFYPGADDNASGTAVVLELARALAAGPPPRRTVVFAGWNGEERGLLGSRHYVEGTLDAATGQQVRPDLAHPIASTIAAFSVDMVGAGDGTGLLLYNGLRPRSSALATARRDAAAARGMPSATVPREALDASDHVFFDRAGVPAVLALSRGDEPEFHRYYHTPEDTPATLDRRDLATSTRVLWAALQRLAMGEADPRPPNAAVLEPGVAATAARQARMSSITPRATSADSATTNAKRVMCTDRATSGFGASRITGDLPGFDHTRADCDPATSSRRTPNEP